MEASGWLEFGLRELWQEMFKQVYPDGVNFEDLIAYHRLATELVLSVIILCKLNNILVPNNVMSLVEKMLGFVMCYTKPDGSVPMIGDADNGRLHRLKVWANQEKEWIDHRYLLAIGAVLYRRDDFAQLAGNQWRKQHGCVHNYRLPLIFLFPKHFLVILRMLQVSFLLIIRKAVI